MTAGCPGNHIALSRNEREVVARKVNGIQRGSVYGARCSVFSLRNREEMVDGDSPRNQNVCEVVVCLQMGMEMALAISKWLSQLAVCFIEL